MKPANELQALTTSIGEHSVDAIGAEHLNALEVSLDSRDMTCQVIVALSDNSDAEQRRVLTALLDVESLYYDEAVLSFSFVDSIEHDSAPLESVPQYNYA